MTPPFSEADVRRRIDNPRAFEWSVHGIGMMRTYLDDAKTWRLNLWHDCLINEGISTMHTHPWPFTSYIVAGRLLNTRFQRLDWNAVGRGELWQEGKITCGISNSPNTVFPGLNGAPENVLLMRQPVEQYDPGSSYEQKPWEIHDTKAANGTITIIQRGEMTEGCEASVFWPVDSPWGDASRKFDWRDAERVLGAARRQLEIVEEEAS